MLLNDMLESIHENEETECESESSRHHYRVKYNIETNRLEVYFVEEYDYECSYDNWGEVFCETRIVETQIFFAEHITPQKYLNLLISVLNKSKEELEYFYGNTFNKIIFNRV